MLLNCFPFPLIGLVVYQFRSNSSLPLFVSTLTFQSFLSHLPVCSKTVTAQSDQNWVSRPWVSVPRTDGSSWLHFKALAVTYLHCGGHQRDLHISWSGLETKKISSSSPFLVSQQLLHPYSPLLTCLAAEPWLTTRLLFQCLRCMLAVSYPVLPDPWASSLPSSCESSRVADFAGRYMNVCSSSLTLLSTWEKLQSPILRLDE